MEIVLKISSRQGAVRRVWGEEGKKVRVWFIVKASYYNCYSLADLKLSWQKQKWTNSDQICEDKNQCQQCKRRAWPTIPHEKGYCLYECDHYGSINNHFLCINPFSGWWQTPFRTTGQLGDPRASLLLISEKAVLCEIEKKAFVQAMEKLGHTSWPWWCSVIFEEAAMTGWRKWSG